MPGWIPNVGKAVSCASGMPCFLQTAELMSMQNGQPIIIAALPIAKDLSGSGTDFAASMPSSIWPVAQRRRGWWAVILIGSISARCRR